MVFSSHLFLFYFLPLVLVLYFTAPRSCQHLALCLLSYAFYGWANPSFMILMLVTTMIVYFCGLVIAKQSRATWKQPIERLETGGSRTRAQRIALAMAVCANLSILGFFKYFNFATENYDALVAALGFENLQLQTMMVVTLPLGLSFYTFQSMSYAIDVYRGDATAVRNPIDFACYVAMFPQLVAGPIIRFSEVDDQLRHRTHTLEKFTRGVAFISLGLAKKVFLANACGKVADIVFDAGAAGMADSWVGALAYTFQIYFDFSAYSDMAIGLGLMLGFVFPKNFDSPYISASITEFWRRWHISLSSWLRDNLYIPLGGSRKGSLRTYVNLAVVMLLGGLWHGAAWTFLIWGGIHGALLAFERMMGKDSLYRNLPRFVRVTLTFVIVMFAWVFFRSADLSSAVRYCAAMVGLGGSTETTGLIGGVIYQPYYIITVITAAVVTWTCPQTWNFTRHLTWPKVMVILLALVGSIIVLTAQEFNPFIYFIF